MMSWIETTADSYVPAAVLEAPAPAMVPPVPTMTICARRFKSLSRDERAESLEINVAAADDHAHALAFQLRLDVASRCEAQRTRRLDEHLHPCREEAHRVDQIRV